MISGMYLGELTRQLLLQLTSTGALFARNSKNATISPKKSIRSKILATPWSLTTANIAMFVEDSSEQLNSVASVFSEVGEDGHRLCSIDDRRIIKEISTLVGRRAARLSAMGIAAVLTQIKNNLPQQTSVPIVGVDGSVFKKFPNFRAWMEQALIELESPCILENAEDGSGLGAAIVALVAENGGALKRSH
jgi:hexokinase